LLDFHAMLQEGPMKPLRVVYGSHHLRCNAPQRPLHSTEWPRPAEVAVQELVAIAASLSDEQHLEVVQFELTGSGSEDSLAETARPSSFKNLTNEVAATEIARHMFGVQSSALADVRPALFDRVRPEHVAHRISWHLRVLIHNLPRSSDPGRSLTPISSCGRPIADREHEPTDHSTGGRVALSVAVDQEPGVTEKQIKPGEFLIPAILAGDYNAFQVAALVVAVAGGSVVASHVNDSGFWLVGRFFEMDVKTTLKTWTVMETTIGVMGFAIATAVFGVASLA
jgi:hypothetical protein